MMLTFFKNHTDKKYYDEEYRDLDLKNKRWPKKTSKNKPPPLLRSIAEALSMYT